MNILSITQCNWWFNSSEAALNPQRKVKLPNTGPWYAALDTVTSIVEQAPYKTRVERSEWLRRGGQFCSWHRLSSLREIHQQRHLHSCFCQARDSREVPPRGGFVCTEQDGFQTAGNWRGAVSL